MKIVKFCNIKNVYETRTAARLGADYLGFHLISESDFKRISEIKISIRELKKTYPKTKSVLVTKETNIKKLKSILDEMEFEVVQLHYPDSTNIIAQIRSLYGSRLKIIQVITTNNTVLSPLADIYLLDKSFLGGTGEEIGLEKIEKYLKIINKPNVLLAGGITIDNIDKYLNLRIIGFDIQTGIKSAYTNIKDNTDPTKIAKITKILHKAVIIPQNQVGYVIQDINQQNNDSLDNALHAKVDFLHIDISDGFINQPT
ncbi:MAG TPA: hypothetical protein PLB11_09885, partial [Flavobacterium sp.]|nr:hypothetical protein [Flavobacterium sp.]